LKELENLAERMAEEMGLVMVDFEQGPGFIRIVVDGDGGVTVEECAALSRRFSKALDDRNPLAVEVSSPGLDRVLRTPRERAWAVGKRVKAVTRDGRVRVGRLISSSAEEISLDGEVITLAEISRLSLAEDEK
jgi:ribosome maturation factor RimP